MFYYFVGLKLSLAFFMSGKPRLAAAALVATFGVTYGAAYIQSRPAAPEFPTTTKKV